MAVLALPNSGRSREMEKLAKLSPLVRGIQTIAVGWHRKVVHDYKRVAASPVCGVC